MLESVRSNEDEEERFDSARQNQENERNDALVSTEQKGPRWRTAHSARAKRWPMQDL